MNLFEFFVNLNDKTNKARTRSWVETTAVFTGRRNRAATRTKTGFHEADYYEYEFTYTVKDKKRHAWHTFYPLPDPDIEEIEGRQIRIKYDRHKPFNIVVLEEEALFGEEDFEETE